MDKNSKKNFSVIKLIMTTESVRNDKFVKIVLEVNYRISIFLEDLDVLQLGFASILMIPERKFIVNGM